MSNLILWAHQCTMDYNYRVGEAISRIARSILRKGILNNSQEAKEILTEIQQHGIKKDRKVSIRTLAELEAVQKLVEGVGYRAERQVGGDPAIAAIRGHLLRLGPPPNDSDLPNVFYVGLMPRSVEEALTEFPEQRSAFRVTSSIDARPKSVGLEADVAKLIFIYGPGRSIRHLAPKGNFNTFLESIAALVEESPEGRLVLAINAARPRMVRVTSRAVFNQFAKTASHLATRHVGRLARKGSATRRASTIASDFRKSLVDEKKQEVSDLLYALHLLRDVKNTNFGSQVRTFVATRDFGDDAQFSLHVLYLLEYADILSANESEIDALHTALKGSFVDISLALKLRELPFKAIKVCHSDNGVIMDLGCRPESIITSSQFREDPAGFLSKVLRYSADGATYAMDATAGFGRTANESMIRIYSRHVAQDSRQHERFRSTFLKITEPMPAGMVAVSSAKVVRTLGAIVGLGAIFDGLLLSFLLRD